MSERKVVLVACGTAVATSTVVANAIESEMKKRGLAVETRQCKASEVAGLAGQADLIVSTTPISARVDVPVITTLAFLTGMGREEALDDIERHLRG